MSLEWFYRMEQSVRQSLPDVCEGLDEFDVLFDTDTTTKHPSFIFSVAVGFDEGEQEEFCLIHFDPINQEFYSYHSDDEVDLEVKVLFGNLDEMLSFIHAAFHEYLDEVEDEEDLYDDDEDEFDDDEDENGDESEDYDETDDGIEWISNDKYIHIEESTPDGKVQLVIHYKLGIVPETGEGVLLRNTVTREDDEDSEEGLMIFFKEEEASYITDLMGEYLAFEAPVR